jgi:hypothetical protein
MGPFLVAIFTRGNRIPRGAGGVRRRVAIKRTLSIAVFLATISALPPGLAGASGSAVGVVRNSIGTAAVIRGGLSLPAPVGTQLLAGDTLSTGPDGSLGAILRDDSTLALGPDSSIVVRNFDFSPEKGKFGLLIRIASGTMAYLSGRIGKLAPETARFETPVATIGIRGTRFAVQVGKPALQ